MQCVSPSNYHLTRTPLLPLIVTVVTSGARVITVAGEIGRAENDTIHAVANWLLLQLLQTAEAAQASLHEAANAVRLGELLLRCTFIAADVALDADFVLSA